MEWFSRTWGRAKCRTKFAKILASTPLFPSENGARTRLWKGVERKQGYLVAEQSIWVRFSCVVCVFDEFSVRRVSHKVCHGFRIFYRFWGGEPSKSSLKSCLGASSPTDYCWFVIVWWWSYSVQILKQNGDACQIHDFFHQKP